MTATLTGQILTDAGTTATPAERVYVIEDRGRSVLVAPVTGENTDLCLIDDEAAMWVSRDRLS